MDTQVSVIMPLYNKAPYLEQSIRSVLNQSYAHWQLIVVDDGSTDGSGALAEALLQGEERATVVHRSNAGVAAARNYGVSLATGQYIAFLDADDWWDSGFLDEMLRFAQRYSDAGLWASNYWYVKRGNTHVALHAAEGYVCYPEFYLQQRAMPIWTGAVLMLKQCFEALGGFTEGICLGEDFMLWARVALAYKIVFCSKVLSYYNNDVPSAQRATRNVYAPHCNMIFLFDALGEQIDNVTDSALRAQWHALLDSLRITGLMDYWLSPYYHAEAAAELQKVDWSLQPIKVRLRYRLPLSLLRSERYLRCIASRVKQMVIKVLWR